MESEAEWAAEWETEWEEGLAVAMVEVVVLEAMLVQEWEDALAAE